MAIHRFLTFSRADRILSTEGKRCSTRRLSRISICSELRAQDEIRLGAWCPPPPLPSCFLFFLFLFLCGGDSTPFYLSRFFFFVCFFFLSLSLSLSLSLFFPGLEREPNRKTATDPFWGYPPKERHQVYPSVGRWFTTLLVAFCVIAQVVHDFDRLGRRVRSLLLTRKIRDPCAGSKKAKRSKEC